MRAQKAGNRTGSGPGQSPNLNPLNRGSGPDHGITRDSQLGAIISGSVPELSIEVFPDLSQVTGESESRFPRVLPHPVGFHTSK